MKPIRRLFEVPPAEFTATRNALVRELRDAGRSDEAKTVAAVRKPPATLWIVNQLGPRHGAEVQALIDATRAVAKAQAGGHGDLREAMQAQREALQKTMDAVPALAREVEARITPELQRRVQTTLQSAVAAEPDALLEGTLQHELEAAGFGELLGKVSVAPQDAHKAHAAPARAPAHDKAAEAAARRAEAERQRALKAAEREVERLDKHARAAEEKAAKAEQEAARLRKAADEARAQANEAAASALKLRSPS
jgi:hypothetical protein